MTESDSLLYAYVVEAKAFATMHGLLMIACVILWAAELRRLAIEKSALEDAGGSGFPADPGTEIGQLSTVACALAEKDRLLDAVLLVG